MGADAPSGENLEYDPLFTELELVAAPGEERQVGSSVIEAEEPDWRAVAEKATAVLEVSHDLRAAVFMANAQLRLKGLAGFADAVAYIRGALTDYWATCHPQLDADDDDDPTMRVNAIFALSDPETTLRGLRQAPLTQSRGFGQFGLRDVMISEGELPAPAGADAVDAGLIAAAAQDTAPEKMAEISGAAKAALEDLRAIDRIFTEKTPGRGPDLDAPIKMLARMVKFLGAATGAGAEEAANGADLPEDGEPAAADQLAGATSRAGISAPGTIASSADVVATLDRIMAYYARHEPSSPVPLLLARAKRLVNADFLTVLRDMAPLGVDNVLLIGGMEPKD